MAALLTKTLGVICPSCDFLNVVGAVRCMACGSATDGSAPAERKPQPAPAPAPVAVAPAPVAVAPAPVAVAPAPVAVAPAPVAVAAAPIVIEPAPVEIPRTDDHATTPGTPMPVAPPAEPPGLLKRVPQSSPTPVPQAAPAPARGPPPRPTFASSNYPAVPPSPAQPTPAQAPAPGPRFGLTVLAGPSRGQRFKLGANGAQIGSAKGLILFTDDPFVSPLHATLTVRDGRLFIRDEASTSGVYVSINGTETIPAGGTFCTGLRLFRFLGAIDPPEPWNRQDVLVYGSTVPNNQVHYAVEEVLIGDRGGRCLLSPGPVVTVGQGRCDFSYPNDDGLAPRHCELAPLPTGAMIRDLSGGLGTFVRISGERALKAGDRVRIGQQTLQVEAIS